MIDMCYQMQLLKTGHLVLPAHQWEPQATDMRDASVLEYSSQLVRTGLSYLARTLFVDSHS